MYVREEELPHVQKVHLIVRDATGRLCFGTSLHWVLSFQAKIRSVWVYLLLDKKLQGDLLVRSLLLHDTRGESEPEPPSSSRLTVPRAVCRHEKEMGSRREFEFLALEDFGVVDVEKVAVEGSLDDPGNDGDQVDLVLGKVPALRVLSEVSTALFDPSHLPQQEMKRPAPLRGGKAEGTVELTGRPSLGCRERGRLRGQRGSGW